MILTNMDDISFAADEYIHLLQLNFGEKNHLAPNYLFWLMLFFGCMVQKRKN
jgi:hypothetical protein